MKKKGLTKKVKKLKLSSETLRNLTKPDLQAVVGGATIICSERCTTPSCHC
ncbi:MAG TPA: hypothetical protein VF179_15640 [Thermoanaerobaculia bacterium]|nr:hypothetical protein [Thermoanaerobaculia bacterium]